MERIKSVTMLIISFPVSGTAPQEARLLGLGVGRKAVWNLEGGSPGVQAGSGSVR